MRLWRLVLVSRALPSATPVCSPSLLSNKLQDSGESWMSHQYSFYLGPRALDNYFRPNLHPIGSLALFRSLRWNNLGEQTGVALGKALETNTSLQNLK